MSLGDRERVQTHSQRTGEHRFYVAALPRQVAHVVGEMVGEGQRQRREGKAGEVLPIRHTVRCADIDPADRGRIDQRRSRERAQHAQREACEQTAAFPDGVGDECRPAAPKRHHRKTVALIHLPGCGAADLWFARVLRDLTRPRLRARATRDPAQPRFAWRPRLCAGRARAINL